MLTRASDDKCVRAGTPDGPGPAPAPNRCVQKSFNDFCNNLVLFPRQAKDSNRNIAGLKHLVQTQQPEPRPASSGTPFLEHISKQFEGLQFESSG